MSPDETAWAEVRGTILTLYSHYTHTNHTCCSTCHAYNHTHCTVLTCLFVLKHANALNVQTMVIYGSMYRKKNSSVYLLLLRAQPGTTGG
jgi:hypothetical protein